MCGKYVLIDYFIDLTGYEAGRLYHVLHPSWHVARSVSHPYAQPLHSSALRHVPEVSSGCHKTFVTFTHNKYFIL